ncbi:hypothetical protein LCGC14_1505110 [marine sediment metagenome]|uniref:Uncharacterized protein n=1 Tax=marine sediment metagenome TaxID=412755 RepID=A0A0F9J3D5_9ZZZZ|nr:MAG: hypothetical protein Lokiarch_44000 [Candidatus Lokiarchaeum sp. GC14_75]
MINLGAGKIFCILGGILALVATLFFSFYSIEVSPGVTGTGYGIGLFLNFVSIFESGNILAIIFSILYAIGVISGVFILIGAGSRAFAIIGAIFALLLGIILLLNAGLTISLGPDIDTTLLSFIADPIVDGILPFNLPLGLNAMSLGTVLLVGGGVLGLIGGIIGTSDL